MSLTNNPNTLYSDLMKHNEALFKKINFLNEVLSLYKKALLDLQAHPTAKKALEEVRLMEKKR